MTDEIRGSVEAIFARLQCGGCGEAFTVRLDPARRLPADWSLHDEAIDVVRGASLETGTSVQSGFLLCEECTKKVDLGNLNDRNATAEEIEHVLSIDAEGGDGGDETDDEEDDGNA